MTRASFSRRQLYSSHNLIRHFVDFASEENELGLDPLIETHLRFRYPKTLVFSFAGYETSSSKDLGALISEDGKISSRILADRSFQTDFLSSLAKFCAARDVPPRVLIDLRSSWIIDENLLKTALETFRQLKLELVVLTDEELREELVDAGISGHPIFYSTDAFFEHIDEVIEVNTARVIHFGEEVSLRTVEDAFEDQEIVRLAKSSEVLELDFTRTRRISTFAVFFLSHLMQDISSRFGVLWKLVGFEEVEGLVGTFTQTRFLERNRNILDMDLHFSLSFLRESLEGLWLTSHPRRLIELFKREISLLGSEYSEYLGEFREKKYESKYSSYKPSFHHITIRHVLQFIAYELVDNWQEHSGGEGALAMLEKGGHLYIFIGDNGIGLRSGLLNNYALDEEVVTDKDALEYGFTLAEHADKRRSESARLHGEGNGLLDTWNNIFLLRGRFMARTGNALRAFMNPVSKTATSAHAQTCGLSVGGVQYFIVIPLLDRIRMPSTTEDFLEMRS